MQYPTNTNRYFSPSIARWAKYSFQPPFQLSAPGNGVGVRQTIRASWQNHLQDRGFSRLYICLLNVPIKITYSLIMLLTNLWCLLLKKYCVSVLLITTQRKYFSIIYLFWIPSISVGHGSAVLPRGPVFRKKKTKQLRNLGSWEGLKPLCTGVWWAASSCWLLWSWAIHFTSPHFCFLVNQTKPAVFDHYSKPASIGLSDAAISS